MSRIDVDLDRCEGSQLCVFRFPRAFEFDDDGFAHVIDEASVELTEDELDSAITLCPADAIRRLNTD